jgi:hypothetical protein
LSKKDPRLLKMLISCPQEYIDLDSADSTRDRLLP